MTFDSTLTELRNQHAARKAYARQDAERARGVCYSGLGPDPLGVPSMEVLLERAERLHAEREAWTASPRGKLLAAIAELRTLTYAAEADAILAAYCRGFQDERERVSTAEVVSALKALDGIPSPLAAPAREALYAILAANESVLANVSAFVREARQ